MGGDDLWEDAESIAAPMTLGASWDEAKPVVEARYERRGELGRGGMGEVEVVRDRWLDRDVARKVLTGGEEDARLAHEAAITARLEHPGIVPVFDVGEDDDGRRFYTMRLVRGLTLAQCMESGADADAELITALRDAAQAVAYAHSVGVVHRDLKPANLVLGQFGEVQVVDWGIALPAGNAGRPEGTPGWSDPSQLAGDVVRPQHDVYALGRCLAAVLGDAPVPELRAVVDHATGPERYADASGFVADLSAWLDGRRVGAHQYSAGELLLRTVRTFRAPLAVAMVSLAVLVAVGAVALRNSEQERQRAQRAEQRAEEALAVALAEQATARFADGEVAEAEALAVRSQALGDEALARGVLAATGARLELVDEQPVPCSDARLLRGGELACVLTDAVEIYRGWPPRPAMRIESGPVDLIRRTSDGYATMSTGRLDAKGHGALQQWSVDGAWQGAVSTTPGHLSRGDGPAFIAHSHAGQRWMDGAFLPAPELCFGRGVVMARWIDSDELAVGCTQHGLLLGPPDALEVEDIGDDVSDVVRVNGEYWAALYSGELAEVRSGHRVVLPGGTANELVPLGDRWIAARPERGGVRVFDARARQWLPPLPHTDASGMAQLGDSLITVGSRLARWRLPEPAPVHALRVGSGVTSIDWFDDGRFVAGMTGGAVVVGHDGVPLPILFESCVLGKDVVVRDDEVFIVCPSNPSLLRAAAQPSGEWAVEETFPGGGGRRLVAAQGALMIARYILGIELVTATGKEHHSDNWDLLELESLGDRVEGLTRDGYRVRIEPEGSVLSDSSVGAHQLALGPDDAVLLGDGTRTWRVDADGRVAWEHKSGVTVVDLAWSPDGRWAALGQLSGHTLLLDAADGHVVAEMVGHAERVAAVSFSPDSALLVTGSWDRSLRVWSVADAVAPPGEEVLTRRYGTGW